MITIDPEAVAEAVVRLVLREVRRPMADTTFGGTLTPGPGRRLGDVRPAAQAVHGALTKVTCSPKVGTRGHLPSSDGRSRAQCRGSPPTG
ncbi:MAG: hypothetical protein JO290_03345 [Sphingomonadaceae bacterium]|nr:hypothetical protein [Sphingomonadaceae bacterium]